MLGRRAEAAGRPAFWRGAQRWPGAAVTFFDEERLRVLACPHCHGRLRCDEPDLACCSCGARYPVRGGVPALFPWAAGEPSAQWAVWKAKLELLQRWREQTWDGGATAEKLAAKADDLTESFVRFIAPAPDDLVLEIGCGEGGLRTRLPRPRYWGVDPLPFSGTPREDATLVQGVGEKLPLAGEVFGMVLLCQTLDHCFDPGLVLDEARRVLRRGGRLAVMQSLAVDAPVRPPLSVRVRTALSDWRRRMLGNPRVDAAATKTHPLDRGRLLRLITARFRVAGTEDHGAVCFVHAVRDDPAPGGGAS